MPRSRRIDAHNLFQHVVVRGVERRTIFVDDEDRRDLLRRLDRILLESRMPCLAWALIPNHFHLLVQTTSVSISRVMARLGTGYVRRFNRRHGRVGHLFQNRFKSRAIQDDADLRGVLRYIHLNPIKHGLVPSVDELASYGWCGQRAMMGVEEPWPFHDVAAALRCVDPDPACARDILLRELRQGAEELDASAREAPRGTIPAEAAPPEGVDEDHRVAELIDVIARSLCLSRREVTRGSKAKQAVRARSLIAYHAYAEHGVPVARLAPALGVSETGVRRAIEAARVRIAGGGQGAAKLPSVSRNDRNAGPSPNGGQ
jgi:REP element-mobilizing transposase RayT